MDSYDSEQSHIYSIFQALQDKQSFAPLTFQNFQIFAHFRYFCRFVQNVAEIFTEIADFSGEIFTDFGRNFGKLQTIAGSHYLLHQFLEIREKMVQKFINF